jgi:DOPA 4,5-dioxygenase
MEAFPWLRAHKPCWDTPVGPHPQPMVEIDFDVPENASELQAVVGWLAREHGGLSVLVHPNTLDGGVADHTDHALWLGPPLQPILAVLGG